MHPAATMAMQHRRGRSLGSGGLNAVRDRDEDLVLFHEMQRREREDKSFIHPANIQGNLQTPQGTDKPLSQSIQRALIGRNDDLLSSDWDRNDYDWLLTPPTTPLVLPVELESPSNGFASNGTTSVRSAIKVSRLGSSKSEPPSRAEPSSRMVRGNVGIVRSNVGPLLQSASINTSPSLPSSTSMVARRSLPSSSNGASRSSTPTSSAARRPSTPNSSTSVSRPSAGGSTTVASRPSTPTSRVGAPRPLSTNPSSTVRPAAPPGRTPSPITRSASSSRPSTPVKRPSTPTRQSTPSSTMVRSTSISKAGGPTATRSAASSRASSPTVKALHPAVVPGISQEPPPNLRTSMPERSSSNSRGSSVTSRSGGPLTARTSQLEAPERRRQSSSPLVTRGRLSSELQTGDRAIHMNGKHEVNGALESSTNGISNKMVDKTARPRRPMPPQDEQGSTVNALVKRTPKPAVSRDGRSNPVREVKSSPSRDVKSSTSSVRESSGFGRNLSKKSLDMALRHMDIHRSTSNGFQSFMSNVSASSLYSIKSSAARGVSPSFLTGSPVATSSNASSEHSASIVLDREGSEQGDERASEKASKSSPGSQQNALFSLTNERRVTRWLGNPGCRENGGDVMQIFEQGIEALSGSESPLVSPHHNATGVCGNFSLEPMPLEYSDV